MATKDEALLMAIEALETAEIQSEYDGLSNLIFKAIQACKEALAQPAQEPVAYIQASEINYIKAMKEEGIKEWRTCLGMNYEAGDVSLYTHPTPSWVGLSDDEIGVLFDSVMANDKVSTEFFGIEFARAIEQALREKNT